MTDPLLYTPIGITAELKRFGGKNPYGAPRWRLILAEKHTVTRGGIWRNFRPGEQQFDFNSAGGYRYQGIRPESADTGILEVPLYPVKGWVLEKWFPAIDFGTRKEWESQKDAETGLPLMGPYPSEGDWWMLAGPWQKQPNPSYLKDLIRIHERFMDSVPPDGARTEAALNRYIREQEEMENRQFEQYLSERNYAMKHIVQPVLRSTSLSASRYRQQVAQRRGLKEHIPLGG